MCVTLLRPCPKFLLEKTSLLGFGLSLFDIDNID